uniref:Protein quiver n=1 Tax=Timema bartmani TaxID=61472 RepID=A0A7R9FA88_9NEOP|nr:unnamed protein product [Timema bartmani]
MSYSSVLCVPGSSLKCYNCDPHKSCDETDLKDCTYESFSAHYNSVFSKSMEPLETNINMKCVRLTSTGELPKANRRQEVVRTCIPNVPNMCEVLENLTAGLIKGSDIQDLKLKYECDVCDTDGCNAATTPLPAMLSVAAIAFFWLLIKP